MTSLEFRLRKIEMELENKRAGVVGVLAFWVLIILVMAPALHWWFTLAETSCLDHLSWWCPRP